jgi:hypothetical protein
VGDLTALFGTELDTADLGFLLRLSFSVYRLFEQLITDLAGYSAVIKEQVDGSRFIVNEAMPELACYESFLAQVTAQAE